jgi:integrase
MRRFPLGSYATMSISGARDAARLLHAKVRHEGADPIADRRNDRARGAAAAANIGTLAALLGLYARQRGNKLRSWNEYAASIRRVFGAFMSRPLDEIRPHDLQLTADSYPAQQQAALAVRCIRPTLRWGSAPARGYCPPELANISPPAPTRRRDRVLSREELAMLLPVLRASDRPYAQAMRFMLLTLLRKEEAAGARWRDVNFQARTLTISGERTKNQQPHVLPLSDQALATLRAIRPETVDDNALIFATRTGGALTHWHRETKRVQAASGTSGWHRHDLRRSAATLLGEMGEAPHVIEASLNHAAIHSQIATTYNKARYRPQVAAALQQLGDALDAIEAGASNVVPLHAARSSTVP